MAEHHNDPNPTDPLTHQAATERPVPPTTPTGPDRIADETTRATPESKSARQRRTPADNAEPHPQPAHQRRRRIIAWAMIGAGITILAGTAWVGWRSYQAYTHLTNASADVSALQDQLKDITTTDPTATTATVNHLQTEASAARSAVDDPIYRAATATPFIGANLDAIRQVTLTVNSLATDVMPSLTDIAQTMQPAQLAPTNGAINIEPIERISPLLQNADTAVNQARQNIATIDRTTLIQPISDAVLTLSRKLDQAAAITGPGARIARLAPPMLGSNGPRTYLVAFQNPAELRATGGILGSYAVIQADQGKITIIDQGGASSRKLGIFEPPVTQLTTQQRQAYTDRPATYPQDVNLTPDFPTAAALFTQMYQTRTGNHINGVMAIDPIALSYMLKGTAPIDVGDGVTVTSDNLVPVLLSTAYQKFDESDQSPRDAFLAHATALVFTEVMSGKADRRAILDGLRKASDERRVLLYSADPTEQADIATTGISGAIDQDPTHPSIGVYMNDGTGAKLGYYLHNEVHVTNGACHADGRRELQVRVTMHYNAPPNGLPAYVTGTTDLGKRGGLQTNVLVQAPIDGHVTDAHRDGTTTSIGRSTDHARETATTTVILNPDSSAQLDFTVLGPADPATNNVTPNLTVTPGIQTWTTSVDPYQACPAPTN